VNESQDILGSSFDDSHVAGSKEDDEVLKVNEEAIEDYLWVLLLLHVNFLGIYLHV
jgi:hypothetical protein